MAFTDDDLSGFSSYYLNGSLPEVLFINLGVEGVGAGRNVLKLEFSLAICAGIVGAIDHKNVCLHVFVDFTIETNEACVIEHGKGNGLLILQIAPNIKAIAF